MKEKYLLIALAATAVLAGCKKGNLPDRGVAQPIIFTATAEDNVETRTTFDPADRRIFWEEGDRVNINGYHFTAQNAGASTTFIGYDTEEVRPAFVSSQSGGFDGQKPQMLVDDKGTETKWCANNNHKGGSAWTIIVSASCLLQSIKVWNGGDTQDFPGRRWRDVTVSGSASESGPWEEIKSFQNLDLAANNGGLAGTLNVDATASYQYYKIDISAIMSGDTMQMSDMKFLGTITSPYTAYFPESLLNNGTPTLPSSVEETWAEGRFNMPMYAYSTSKDLEFKNLCGILKVVVKNNQLANVRHINVSSSNCATSGAFTVKDNKAVLTSPSATANTITINYTASVPTSSEGTAFYVPIPAQKYQNLSITVSNGTTAKVMTTKKDVEITVARNTVYPIAFDGQPTTGSASRKDGNDVNWVQLWAGGPKFAEYNVGAANNKPEDYGGYYCWGKSINKDPYGTYKEGSVPLSGDDDTATNLWGSNWRMPTDAELQGLIDNCTVVWTTVGGKNGRKFTGKGAYSSNSVFFPAAGHNHMGADYSEGEKGYYWSSTPSDGHASYLLLIKSNEQSVFGAGRGTYGGCSVRAVLAE